MARSRNIKPGLFKNEVLGVADPLYTLLFEGLWLLADREGRLEDRPLRIKGEVFPYRDGLDMNAMLDWLQANGFIRRYTAAGKKCIFIVEFRKHQNPHKNETESELPAPESAESESDEIGTTSEKIGSAPADSLSSDSLIPDSGLLEGQSASPPTRKKPAKAQKVPLPEGFAISERVRRWADEKGFGQLEAHFESFISKAKAKAYTYADWDEGLMGAIRDDWAKLRNQPARASPLSRQSESDRRINEFLNGFPPDDGNTIDMETIR